MHVNGSCTLKDEAQLENCLNRERNDMSAVDLLAFDGVRLDKEMG